MTIEIAPSWQDLRSATRQPGAGDLVYAQQIENLVRNEHRLRSTRHRVLFAAGDEMSTSSTSYVTIYDLVPVRLGEASSEAVQAIVNGDDVTVRVTVQNASGTQTQSGEITLSSGSPETGDLSSALTGAPISAGDTVFVTVELKVRSGQPSGTLLGVVVYEDDDPLT